MQSESIIPTRASSNKIPASVRSDPFREEKKRERTLRPLKQALIAFGGSGRRSDFKLVRRLFDEIQELRSA